MTVKNLFIRNIVAQDLIEIFMVSAISSILVIRFYLHFAGYPQIGGNGLHIAHLLFGGFFMMVALILLFSFLSRRMYNVAAVLGGIGFGTFLDELGKFLTSDNNYFFEPTVAIMYVIFIIIYLVTHVIESRVNYTKTEYIANAFSVLQDATIQDLNSDERRIAMGYLRRAGKDNPLVRDLHKLLDEIETIPTQKTFIDKIEDFVKEFYRKVIEFPLFYKGVILYFVASSFLSLVQSIALLNTYLVGIVSFFSACILFYGVYRSGMIKLNKLQVILIAILFGLILFFGSNSLPTIEARTLNFTEIGELFSTTISVILVSLGIFKLKDDRLAAFQYFKYSVLVSIFLTNFFVFYKIQFAALIGLTFNILTLAVLEYMISREQYVLKKGEQKN
jgi:hypothetical protein